MSMSGTSATSGTSGAVAVVTGAGSGIGRACAERLAKDGYRVVCVDVDADRAQQAADAVGGQAAICDVADEDSIVALARSLDRVDVLVNNAGVWDLGAREEPSAAQLRRIIDVNVLGTLLCTRRIAPLIPDGGGSVINMASVLGSAARPGGGIYPATKAAVIALTRQAAMELAARGIRVNAVGPGLIRTEGTSGLFGPTPEAEERFGALLPLGRLGEGADVADVVSFLASPEARYITGQVVYVDGGLLQSVMPLLFRARAAQSAG